jgi:hypothetical protein
MTKRTLLVLLLLTVPLVSFAASVIAKPENPTIVLPLQGPGVPQEFFGQLSGFPHTFEFVVSEKMPFKAEVFARDAEEQKNDVSIIAIKEERRGVSEVGRTNAKAESWEVQKDTVLAEAFRRGGALESELEPGVYRLEVSAPNNDGAYRLVLGTSPIKRGYFANVGALFAVKQAYGSSLFSVFLSPLIYVPFLIILLSVLAFVGYRFVRKYRSVFGHL